jgi:hypothetical protein
MVRALHIINFSLVVCKLGRSRPIRSFHFRQLSSIPILAMNGRCFSNNLQNAQDIAKGEVEGQGDAGPVAVRRCLHIA